jgi:hypothetical protein
VPEPTAPLSQSFWSKLAMSKENVFLFIFQMLQHYKIPGHVWQFESSHILD